MYLSPRVTDGENAFSVVFGLLFGGLGDGAVNKVKFANDIPT